MANQQPPRKQIHDKFDPNDSDIAFESSDNVVFKLHRKNLELSTGGFAGPEFVVDGENIKLPESAETLEVLFDFIYPDRRRKASKLEFEILAQVAEAADKYQVYVAMDACEVQFENLIPAFAARILAHAIKHDYPKLIEEGSLALCLWPISEVIKNGLPTEYSLQWSLYQENCRWLVFGFAENHATSIARMIANPTERGCAIAITYWLYQAKRMRTFDDIKNLCLDGLQQHKEMVPSCPYNLDSPEESRVYQCDVLDTVIKWMEDGMNRVRIFPEESFSAYLHGKQIDFASE